MTLEEEIANTLGQEIAREIDKEILWGMLQGIGWVRVTLPSFRNNHQAVDISYWIEENCQGNIQKQGSDFLFENGEDAVLFTLRWMS